MSRIGKLPILLPDDVRVELGAVAILVRGPKGELSTPPLQGIQVSVEGGNLLVAREGDQPETRARHGLMRANLANMVHGVHAGFEKKLEILGVGYKAEVQGDVLVLTLGYSHQIRFSIPKGIKISVEKSMKITIHGADKQQVGQVASDIRGMRAPDSYKGKGIRFEGEKIKLKAGKSAA
jgi:large subunit ribosomal protein L6